MTLLLDQVDVLDLRGDPGGHDVTDVQFDSRQVGPGDVFCCVPGAERDGHEYAPAAVAAGAVGVVCERDLPGLDPAAVQVRVGEGTMRPVMARLAAAVHGWPARDLQLVGVTGTNGKTTVTRLLGAVLETADRPTSVIGTLSGARTTPEAPDLQRLLAGVRDAQAADGRPRSVAMEVSSHALVQSRVDEIVFDVAVFTNLSHDHLDYHGTMEEYFAAKASLFTPAHADLAVVHMGDEWGRRLAAEAAIPVHPVDRGLATAVTRRPGSTRFVWRDQEVVLPLTGAVNVDNALLAAEAAVLLGLDPATVARGLGRAEAVPGRLELVAGPGTPHPVPFTVLVDYAHTPAGLTVVLDEARHLAGPGGRVVAVFGCGGDRDRAKRPLMGAAATAGADLAVLTSDNPRHEDPGAIIEAVAAGSAAGAALTVEPDRRRAIALALGQARPGDVVVVAGKGHETVQEVGDRRLPFDDRQVVTDLVALGPREA